MDDVVAFVVLLIIAAFFWTFALDRPHKIERSATRRYTIGHTSYAVRPSR